MSAVCSVRSGGRGLAQRIVQSERGGDRDSTARRHWGRASVAGLARIPVTLRVAEETLPLAPSLELVGMPMGPQMQTIIDEMSTLGRYMLEGNDANGNGNIEAISGECGADFAYYDNVYPMVDMDIFIGPNRVPPPGK